MVRLRSERFVQNKCKLAYIWNVTLWAELLEMAAQCSVSLLRPRAMCHCVLSAPAERRRPQPRHWMNRFLSTRHLECSTLHKKALRAFETSSAEWQTTQRHTSEDLRLQHGRYENPKSRSSAHVERIKKRVPGRNEVLTASLCKEIWMFREFCDGFHQARCRQ